MKFSALLLLLLMKLTCIAQNKNIDVLSYDVDIHLSDSSDNIFVSEKIVMQVNDTSEWVWLDLHFKDTENKGLRISKDKPVLQNGTPISYEQDQEKVYFHCIIDHLPAEITLEFSYGGIPVTGLIISKNKFGERTFFGDNWPDRAHHWIACNDHPSDKAFMNFQVTAPSHYDCVATGSLISSEEKNGFTSHNFHSTFQLPTKVMVIGLAEFFTKELEYQFPLEGYVYKKDAGSISDLDCAKGILDFFIGYIGPYPYEKLYNVQSTTQFGGMENAGNIFYDEGAFKGKGTMEVLVAHEIAHQWFGNSASESDWQHLWLSEGFATYFTDLYWQYTYGDDAFRKKLQGERDKVLSFFHSYDHPVIDTTYTSLMNLLNPNSYQKGAWILHMLREKAGDIAFREVIRRYYDAYQYSNASSNDFIEIAGEVLGEDQHPFFDQWLTQAGHPVLNIDLKTHKKGHQFTIMQTQQQGLFNFPLEIRFNYTDGTSDIISFDVKTACYIYEFCTDKKISSYEVDPKTKLLFELQKKSLH